jgi:cell division protein FtsL
MVLAIQQLDVRTKTVQQQRDEIAALKTAYETQSAELKQLRAEVAEVRRSIRIRTAQR